MLYQVDTITIDGSLEPYPFSAKKRAPVKARLDSTVTTRHNAKYWNSAESGITPQVIDRMTNETARNRCRYEYLNNVVMFGAGLTKTAYNIGVGARLQLLTKDKEWNKHLETEFQYWCEDVRWNKNFRLAPKCLLYDGEYFLRFRRNPKIKPTQLDITVLDGRLLRTPTEYIADTNVVDGIRYDQYFNPVCYYFQKVNRNPVYIKTEFEEIPAEQIIHFFDYFLPNQFRGLPESQAGISQLAMGRMLTKHVLAIAEIAARSPMVLETDVPAEGAAEVDGSLMVDLDPYQVVAMPEGGKINYPKSPQFAVDLNAANLGINNQFGMGTGLPSNAINNDSSRYNFSSARLDRSSAGVLSEIRQSDFITEILSPLYSKWHRVQANFDKVAWDASREYGEARRVPRRYTFPEWPSVNPKDDAMEKKTLIGLGVMLREDVIRARGHDPEEFAEKYREEQKTYGGFINVESSQPEEGANDAE